MNRKWLTKKALPGQVRTVTRASKDPKADPDYLEWVRTQPCAVALFPFLGATPCRGPIEAHHPIGAGMALKNADREAFALCQQHHVPEFHALKGAFYGWLKSRLKTWQREMSREYQRRRRDQETRRKA